MKTSAPPPAALAARIARRVRSLRADLGLSLDTLAAKSDVSRSMLSLVERGESSPTAVLLEKIATGLGVPLATLFNDAGAAASPIARRADHTPWRDPQSGYVRRNISPANFPSPIQIVEVVLPAGAHVAYETGVRDIVIQQQIWVREGNVEVTIGAVAHRLAEDDCLAMRLNEPTAFRNRTRRPARYIVVIVTGHVRATPQTKMSSAIQIRCLEAFDERDINGLCEVLIDCVEGGASVSFMWPMTRAKAEVFWRGVAASAGRGERRVLVAEEVDGTIVGTAQVILNLPENQPHRGDVAKMLVHRRARRAGVGAGLLAAVERVAFDLGRTLLVLDTVTGSDAERMYVRHGWQRCGEIPDYALWPDGRRCPTTYFYKSLGRPM